MNEPEQKKVIGEMADKLDLPYSDVFIEQFPGIRMHSGICSRIVYENSQLFLQSDDLSSLDERIVLGMMEHYLCHCKNLGSRVYSHELIVPSQNDLVMVTGIYNAYTSHFSSHLQKRIFNSQNLHAYNAWRTKQSKELLTGARDIPLLFEDAVRGFFASENPIPRYVKEMCAPFPPMFEEINKEGRNWIYKSEVLYAIAVALSVMLDFESCQRSGFLSLTTNPAKMVPDFLHEEKIIDKDVLPLARKVIEFLVDKYTEIGYTRNPMMN